MAYKVVNTDTGSSPTPANDTSDKVTTVPYVKTFDDNGTVTGRTTGDGMADGRRIVDTASDEYQARVNAGRNNAGVTTTPTAITTGDDDGKKGSPVGEEQAADPGNGGGGGGGTKKKTSSTTTTAVEQTMAPATPNAEPEVGSLEHIDTTPYEQMLEQQIAAAREQSNNSIDYNVNKSVTELERAQEDAQADFEKQRKQVNTDEAKALQNQALYAEARGDRGGIGAAQYAQIQATAATNRRAVNDAQTKLATDTARQISDLRAQGEFQKADAALTLTQSYLGKLMELWQYSTSTNLSIDQFNIELQKWKENFEVQMSELTGVYKGAYTTSFLASTANTLISYGIMPSSEQLAAIGLTEDQVKTIIKKNKGSGRSGTGSGNTKTSFGSGVTNDEMLSIYDYITTSMGAGATGEQISADLFSNYNGKWTQEQSDTAAHWITGGLSS